MSLVPPDPTKELVTPSPRTNLQRDQGEGDHHHHHSADPSCPPPPSLTAFASVGATPEAEWEDDVPGADSEDDVAAGGSESEDDVPGAESEDDVASDESNDEAEWAAAAAAAAAELEGEAKWEDAAAAESEDGAGGDADTGEPEVFQEARLLKRPPPPVGAGVHDESTWSPKSCHGRRFRELSSAKSSDSSLDNPVLNPEENSLSLPSSNKSKDMLPNKVVDHLDGTEHYYKSSSGQNVPYENGHEENPLPVPPKKIKYSIDRYAVQCAKCRKWRLIPTKIKYDEIREKSRQVPFLCEHVHGWKPGVSCDDPADISQDDGFWAIDRECTSQTPLGWERTISIRREGSSQFADVYYFTPTGKKLRSQTDVKDYLRDNPDCAVGLHESQFSFRIPECLQNYIKRRHRESKRRRQSKGRRQSKPLEPKRSATSILCASNS